MNSEIIYKRPSNHDIKNKGDIYDWDITLGKDHEEYRIIRVDGCAHSTGGKWGVNTLYAFPRNEEPNEDNLIPFNGEVCWRFDVQQTNIITEHQIDNTCLARIYCCDKLVYEFYTQLELAAAKCVVIIQELKDHPIGFGEIGATDRVVGRKVYFRDKPGVITSYDKSGFVIIEPDGDVNDFGKACYESDEDYDNNYEGYVKEDILARTIFWFR